jgi:flagellar export protein FliJ
MPFHFTYQVLLRLRLSLERREQLRLEVVAQEIVRERQQLEALDQEHAAAGRLLAQAMVNGATGAELQFEATCAAARTHRRETIQQRLSELGRLRQAQQAALLRARQDREILESLRCRQLEAYRTMQIRREQQSLDEQFLLGRNFKVRKISR